ncbi:MAG: isoprenyl transferase [Acidobacteriota bacterium]|nr:isoprenyl transferase [Acidobacteriota bacterium]
MAADDRPDAGAEERELLRQIDLTRLPRHVAIIMDGNGRWARQRSLPRVAGHRAGIASVRETVETCARLGVEVLTLYAFSRENWRRPAREVNALMRLLRRYLNQEMHLLTEHQIRFRTIGRVDELSATVRRELAEAVDLTREHEGMTFVIALSYSGRAEIVDMTRRVAEDVASGRLPADAIDESIVAEHLDTAGLPDPDLLVRTSGEMRVSNFLLWQIAYAELWVSKVLWPDFRRRHLYEAIVDYQKRDRRFGGVGDSESGDPIAPGTKGVFRP